MVSKRGKTKIIITAIIILVVILSYFSYVTFVPSKVTLPPGTNITVDDSGGADYTKIQDAINAANEGDIIFVYSGRYRENIAINKAIALIGEQRENTIIDPPEGIGAVIGVYVHANNVKISGFTVEWGGMKIQSSSCCNVANCIISGEKGICVETSSYIEISCCIPSGNIGILLTNSSSNKITSCEISHCPIGIELWTNSNYNEIINSRITYNSCGILVGRSSNYNNIKNCGISNNGGGPIYDDAIVIIHSSNNNTVQCCMISDTRYGACGVFLGYGTSNNVIHHNNFVQNEKQAEDKGQNYWDDGTEGNYWDDYVGEDDNDDSIGDTPYNLPGDSSEDNYPFMNPLNVGVIEEQRETKFSVEVISVVIIVAVIISFVIVVVIRYKRKVGREKEKISEEYISKAVESIMVKCPYCNTSFHITPTVKPFKVKCPNCSKSSLLR